MIPNTLRKLIFELSKLPAIGERSAYRIAYYLLSRSEKDIEELLDAISKASKGLHWCKICCGLTDLDICEICSDARRNPKQLCVVERPSDVFSLERSGAYRGLYHVLHGVWSPLKGITPEKLTISKLISRFNVQTREASDPLVDQVDEVILATSTTVEGDATALYIANELDNFGLQITRLAQGLPKGGELEYADDITLGLSFEGRRKI